MKMEEDSLLQRQEEEWQVLQAVYMDDAIDLRNKTWKVHAQIMGTCFLRKKYSSHFFV